MVLAIFSTAFFHVQCMGDELLYPVFRDRLFTNANTCTHIHTNTVQGKSDKYKSLALLKQMQTCTFLIIISESNISMYIRAI